MHARRAGQRNRALRRVAGRASGAAALAAALVLPGAGPAPAAAATSADVVPNPVGSAQLPARFTYTVPVDPAAAYVLSINGAPQPYTIQGTTLTFTAAPPCGDDIVHLAYANAPNQYSTVYLAVACITATPAQFPSAAQPATVTVSGQWFPTDAPVVLSIDGTVLGKAQSDTDYLFTVPVVASGLACGPHTLTATETYHPAGLAAQIPATVTATAPLTVQNCAAITADPAVVPQGTLTHVTGEGFAPDAAVTLDWQTLDGTVVAGCSPDTVSAPTVAADAAGKIDAYCLAAAHGRLGAAQLVASQDPEKAAAAVVVEAGPMEPSSGGRFVFRH